METTIVGYILGLFRDNGKENERLGFRFHLTGL